MKKFRNRGIIMGILILSMGLFACSNADEGEDTSTEPQEITVSAAASLTESIQEIASNYEGENGTVVNLNLGSSGALQKQIEEGAAVDLFLSAGQSQMDALEEKSLIDVESRVDILENKLVLIVSDEYKNTISKIEDIKNTEERLALGEVETVPVGQYSKESMENQGIWTELEDSLVYGKDVKTVLSYVEKGEAAAGIVYSSDAIDLQSASIAMEIDSSTHRPIVYPAAIIRDAANTDGASDFLEYLSSDSSAEVFEKYGFKVR